MKYSHAHNLLLAVDIDGTIADARERFREAGMEPHRDNKQEYVEWLAKVQNHSSLLSDAPVTPMLALLPALYGNAFVIYLTSREESWRETTERWLRKHKFPNYPLYMRPSGNWQSSGEFKRDAIQMLLDRHKCLRQVALIDDDPLGDIEQEFLKKENWLLLKTRGAGY